MVIARREELKEIMRKLARQNVADAETLGVSDEPMNVRPRDCNPLAGTQLNAHLTLILTTPSVWFNASAAVGCVLIDAVNQLT
jgi:hypothetical protein